MSVQIQLRHDTAANWTAANPTLAAGEAGFETDTLKIKIGNGSTAWNSLAYFGVGFANPMTTLDDIIVGGASGTPARLAKGTDGQVLTVDPSTHHLVWATPASGFADPTTTKGDLIVHGSSTTRLGVGTDGQVLTASSAASAGMAWATPAGGSSRPWLDTNPAISGTYGDDFTGASLDAKWTRGADLVAGDLAYQTGNGSYIDIACATAGGATKKCLYQTSAPAGDFSAYCALAVTWDNAGGSGDNIMVGPGIVDSSGNGAAACVYQGTLYVIGLTARQYASFGASGPTLWTPNYLNSAIGRNYWLRLRKSGTSYYAAASINGTFWFEYPTAYVNAFTVAGLTVGCYYNNQGASHAHLDVFNAA